MRKWLEDPEVLALAPNGIEQIVLHCVVCREPLPTSRRTIGDHAGPCHKVRVLLRRLTIKSTKCIACLHPATPQEREDYRRWRKARGDLREKCGKPKKPVPNPATQGIDNQPEISQGCGEQ